MNPEPKYRKNGELSSLDSGSISRKIELERQEHYNSKTTGLSSHAFDEYQHSQEDFNSKIPAVFKLLRPEFLQQLKLNNCQIKHSTDQTNLKKDRKIPVVSQKTTSSRLDKIVDVQKRDEDTQIEEDNLNKSCNTVASNELCTDQVPQDEERSPLKPTLLAKPQANLAQLKTQNSVTQGETFFWSNFKQSGLDPERKVFSHWNPNMSNISKTIFDG